MEPNTKYCNNYGKDCQVKNCLVCNNYDDKRYYQGHT